MNIVKKKLSDLKPAEKNIRMHPDKQIEEYVRSIKKNGQLKPIVIDENNVIWIGNGLYLAMTKCGCEEAYCLVKEGMTEADKKKMMMADNRIFDLGVDDMSVFDEFLQEFKIDGDLDIPGYADDLIESILADAEDVDDIMSSYGIVDDNKKAEISSAKEEYAEKETTFAQSAQQNVPGSKDEATAVAEDAKYVICPKCGERIWL